MPEDFSDILEEIRKENIIDWGRKFERIGDFLAKELYSDRTHFIYELLQNAEDAFERANVNGIRTEFRVEFKLFCDRLEVRHNGIPFNIKDVKGVCSIFEGTKSGDSTQIGKFGIGFKSVYAFTKSPKIFSEEKAFKIDRYVEPGPLEPRKDVKKGETLIVMPFNNDSVNKEIAYSEIEKRLKNLGIRTTLFLKNTSEILWKINNSTGTYKKEINFPKASKFVKLQYFENAEIQNEENWIVFERPLKEQPQTKVEIARLLKEQPQAKVEIAFLIENEDKSNKKHIVLVPDTFAVAYFPTSIRTNLNFLIQAPFNTTPARDNIREDDEWNKYLIQELGILTAESISNIKNLKLLDYHFLQTLPIDTALFDPYDSMFYPIFQQVKEKLSGEEPLLPTYNRGFTIAKNALLARAEWLRELFPPEILCLLFQREQAIWLDENITNDKTPDVRKYLMEELYIEEIESERVGREFSKEFIEKQSDKWIVQFYSYLNNQEALWRKGQYNKPDGPLLFKPFIRCEDGTHVAPFKPNGDPHVYLPSKFDNLFLTVKKTLLTNEKSKEFLERLGLKEPDEITGIIENILPRYSGIDDPEIPEREHLDHVEGIAKTLTEMGNLSPSEKNARKIELITKIRSTAFLYGRNYSSEIKLKEPSELYLGKTFSGSDDCEIFFEGNTEIWFLDDRYNKKSNLTAFPFKLMGCKLDIQVTYQEPDSNNIVKLVNWGGKKHTQGLRGFDPECEIEGLDYCLDTISEKKSEIIWSLLKLHYNKISGFVESSTRKDFLHSEKNFEYSNFGELLVSHAWLPNNDGGFFKPSDIQLVDLPENYDINSNVANRIAEKLSFKKTLEPSIFDSNPELKKYKSIIEVYKSLSEDKQKKAIELMQKLNEPEIITGSTSEKEIREILNKIPDTVGEVESDPLPSIQKRNLTPEEEETISQNIEKEFPKRLKRLKIALQTTIQQRGKPIDPIEPGLFLLDQYDGQCQLCYEKLDLGNNKKPFFVTHRIIKTNNIHEWTNMEFNVLCLCPNCHARMEHGTPLYLKNIFSNAKLVRNNEIVSAWITEWNQDGYIVKITVAGKEKEIFYSQAHMAKFPSLEEGTKGE